MNLETLQLFCDVVRLHSFSRGASARQVTQSAASQAVQQLEAHLGVKLIDRSQRPFALTPAGKTYYEGVRGLLAAYAQLAANLTRAPAAVEGVVRVAAIYSIGLYDLSRYTQRFTALFPHAKVQLEYLRPNKVYDAVAGEEADLGILSFPKAGRAVLMQPWRRERMVLACPPNHRLAARPLIHAADLQGERFVAFDPDLKIRKAIDHALREQHVHVNVLMEFDNIDSIKRALETSGAVSILPEPTVRRAVEAKRLVSIPLAMTDLVRPVGIIYLRRRPLLPATQKLIELLRQPDMALPPAPLQRAG